MLYRRYLLLAFLPFLLLACAGEDCECEEGEPQIEYVVVTATPGTAANNFTPAAQTGTSVTTAADTTGGEEAAATGDGPCVVRAEWPTYIVQTGENLSLIAAEVGTDSDTLAAANCLANPNNIRVGQALHVPTLPEGYEPPADQPTVAFQGVVGSIIISPAETTGGGYELQAGNTVTLTWNEAPPTAALVSFLLQIPGTPNSAVELGGDADMEDGASLEWVVPPGLTATIHAAAYTRNLSQIRVSNRITVFSPGNSQGLAVTPYVDRETNEIAANELVLITWGGVPVEAVSVDFFYLRAGSSEPLSIAADDDLADGAAVLWFVPQGIEATLQARATLTNGSEVETAPIPVNSSTLPGG